MYNAFLKLISILVIMTMVVTPVMAGFTSNDVSYNDITGAVVIHMRAGGSAEDTLIFICRDDLNVVIDNSYHHDRTEIENQNPDCLKVKILPDGNSEYIRLIPGNYTAYLRNGNSEQPEQQSFIVNANYLSHVSLLGHAVSPTHYPDEKLTVIQALYGADGGGCTIIYHPEVNHTVHHEAGCHNVTIIDTPAWNETIYHAEVNHTVHHDAITHNVTVIDIPAWNETIYHPEVNTTTHNGNYSWTGNGAPDNTCPANDFKYVGEGLGDWIPGESCGVGHSGKTTFIYVQPTIVVITPAYTETIVHPAVTHEETIIDKAAYDEIIVDVPAYTETIVHPAVTHEETVCTGAYDEIIVDVPAWSEEICNKGGFVDVTAIVAAQMKCTCRCGCEIFIDADNYDDLFGDPAPGMFKHLFVKYKFGTIKTITVGENVDLSIPQVGSNVVIESDC